MKKAHKAASRPTKTPPMVHGPAHSETNFRAREDMHVLKQAHQIKADPKRHAAAKDHARDEAHNLKKVAGRKS
jgi:hypothetical protein